MLIVKERGSNFLSVDLENISDTAKLGMAIAQVLIPGMTLLMYGDLGAGKTTLVREICHALGWNRTCSPSFSLVNEYARARIPIAHADLYRVENADGRDFGFDDYLDYGWVLIVEWAERLIKCDFVEEWRIEISDLGEMRSISFSAKGSEAESALRRLEEFL